MRQNYMYDAFISYRHSEPDSFVAQTLHKQLESFKLPKNVARRKTAYAGTAGQEDLSGTADIDMQDAKSPKTRIQRVFRDKEELPLVTNLADPITEALQNSEYLIVICSPRLPESMWCRKEIETFIAMHDREHVLAVLVEGEPDTSFPEELLYREAEETRPDGSVIKKRIPVEPLAADVRGADRNEMRKKIKSELLRLVAPMFNCNYDDLKQRHREQRTRKILMTSVSISAACLLFGIVSTTMALRIQHQNAQIKEQNTRIQAQSDEISAQADKIEEQYKEAKKNMAIARSKEAMNYLAEGDRMRAVATAQDALLDLSERGVIEDDVDYPARAVYALSDSLYLYENSQQILPNRVLEADTAIRVMKLSPEGSRILTVDDAGQIIIWQPSDIDFRVVIDAEYHMSGMENEIDFMGEDRVFCPVGDGVALYDLSGGTAKEEYRVACEDYVGIITLQERNQAVILAEEGYKAIDCADGSTLYEGQWDAEGLEPSSLSVKACGVNDEYWAVSLSSTFMADEEKDAVAVYSADTEERLNLFWIDYEYVKSLRFDGDRIYVVSNHINREDLEQATLGLESRLQAFDIHGENNPVWNYERRNGWLYDTSYLEPQDSSYLLCSGYSDVVVLNRWDGSYLDTFAMGVEVVRLGDFIGNNTFSAFTRDGVWHYLIVERMEDMVGMVFPACTSTNVMDFAMGAGYCVTLPYSSRRMTLYRTARGVGLEEFYRGDCSYNEAALSTDGSYLAASFYNDDYSTAVDLFDTDTGELLWRYEDDSYYKAVQFINYIGQETLALLTSERILILEPESGECQAEFPLEISLAYEYIGCDRQNRRFLLRDSHTIYACDMDDMSSVYEIGHEGSLNYNDAIAVAEDSEFYAVADKENSILGFYRDGKEFFSYGQGRDASRPDYINFRYIETMFFDEGQEQRHLYIVYRDDRIVRLNIDGNLQSAKFCTKDGYAEDSGKYNGLEDTMMGYSYTEGDDYAILRGNTDAYLVTAKDGDILAHLHGFFGYDSARRKLYLVNNRTIYTIPLYDLDKISEIASDVRQDGQW